MSEPTNTEFRVVWKREGLARRTAIYQTLEGASTKADNLTGDFTTVEHVGTGTQPLEGQELLDRWGVPPLDYLHIEERPVGDWQVIETSTKA